MQFPVLETERLVLNRPNEDDLQDLLYHLNQTSEFAENTLSMPFPYEKKNAEFWFSMIDEGFRNKTAYISGIRLKENLKLIGGVGLHLAPEHRKAELGYWLGKDFWNKGYATEAASELIRFGFEEVELNKIFACFFPHNPASGKILQKIGMKKEATLKQEILKNAVFLDLERYSILRSDYYL